METVADIIREMRGYSHGMPASYHVTMSWRDFRVLLDRIEAAHKREAVTDCNQFSDAAKLREALKLCVDEMCDRCRDLAVARGNPLPCLSGCEPVRKAKAALAAPLRNCDRYASAEEAWDAYDEWADSYRAQGKTEPLNEVGWLFAPATEKEGSAK